jgi:hypothetical protein
VPIVLVKILARTQSGQEVRNECYQVRYLKKDGEWQSKISYTHSAVMPLDLDFMVRNFTANKRIGIYPAERVEGDEILNAILRHGVSEVTDNITTTKKPAPSRPDQ